MSSLNSQDINSDGQQKKKQAWQSNSAQLKLDL